MSMMRSAAKSIALRVPHVRRLYQELLAVQHELDARTAENANLRHELDARTAENANLHHEVAAGNAKSQALEQRIAALNAENATVRDVLLQRDLKITELQSTAVELRRTAEEQDKAFKREFELQSTHLFTPSRSATSELEHPPVPICPSCRHPANRRLGRRSDLKELFFDYGVFVKDIQQFDRAIFACDICGLKFIDPLYTSDDLFELYGGNGYEKFRKAIPSPEEKERIIQHYKEHFVRLGLASYKQWFNQANAGRNPQLFDIGCGEGHSMHALRDLGFDVHGIDLNPAFIEELRRQGFDAQNMALEDLAGSETYDVISAFHLIEHLTDPHQLFVHADRLLRKDGVLVIETPFFEDAGSTSQRYRDIYHTLFFDHFSLSVLAAQHGFYARISTHPNWYDIHNGYHNYMTVVFQKADCPAPTNEQFAALRPLFSRLEEEARSWSRVFLFTLSRLPPLPWDR